MMERARGPFAVVWSTNRGVQLMSRVALASARLDAVPVADTDGLAGAIEAGAPAAVLASWDDAVRAGIGVAELRRRSGSEPTLLLLGAWPPDAGGDARARRIPVPFTTREVVEALARGPAPSVATVPGQRAQAPAPTADLVREEVARLVTEVARRAVEEVARKVVPELAETLIREELAKLLHEVEEGAISDGKPGDL
jgi:hypothetical protein